MKIIFFRHGQTEFNLVDKFQGVTDSPLTEKGILQAQKMNAILKKDFKIKKVFLSPAGRVLQTFLIAFKSIDVEQSIDHRLTECCFGNWEGVQRNDIPHELLEKRKLDRYNFVHPGYYAGVKGESFKQTHVRVVPFLKEICSLKIDGDIAVISHKGVMMGILDYFLDYSDVQMGKEDVDNGEYFVWDSNDSSFKILTLN